MSLVARKLLGASAGGSSGPTIAHTDMDASSANQSSYTFSNEAIGAAASTRRVIIVTGGYDASGTGSVSSMTIGGISATKLTDHGATDSGNYYYSSIWYATVPTGTTAAVVVNMSEIVDCQFIQVYRLTGETSMTPVDSDADLDTLSSGAVSLTATEGSIGVGGVFIPNNLGSISLSGSWSEDGEFASSNGRQSGGSGEFSTAGSKSLIASWAGGSVAHIIATCIE